MKTIQKCINLALIFSSVFLLIFSSFPFHAYADDIDWLEVSNTNNEILSIIPKSIKYNNKGFLSVVARYSEIDLDDQTPLNNENFLMAIDCENRLFSKFPINTDIKQVKNWDNPINNKLIKQTIIKSCSY